MPSPPDRLVRLAVGDVEIAVDLDAGARAVDWVVAGHPLLASHGVDPVEHGMYPMAPWAGRLRGNEVAWSGVHHPLPVTYGEWAIHGTALRQEASILARESEPGLARLVARIEDHPGWPWPMAIDVTWELRPRELTTVIEVHALVEPFPAVVGWHPWFHRRLDAGEPLRYELDATARLARGPDHLPTGDVLGFDPSDGPFDDAFVVPGGTVRVWWPGALALDIESDADWYVVFDELPDCACIEPQSGPPDGLRDGLGRAAAVAAPGLPHRLTTTWTMRDL